MPHETLPCSRPVSEPNEDSWVDDPVPCWMMTCMTLSAGQALVWYVSYGSNMCAGRLAAYLKGGRPPGASRTYPGARDPQPPRADAAVWLPGGIYFAGQSSVWTGGTASYDPRLPGRAPAR